jgi:MSHA pilin protein MshD
VTLIELVISIVIISIGLVGVLLAFNRTISTSADPMIQQQAISIGQAYIEEIIGKAYSDPDGAETGETGRTDWDDVSDYNGLSDAGARSQIDPTTSIAGLARYNVTVAIATATLGGAPAKLITVTVSHPDLERPIVLQSYRTDY